METTQITQGHGQSCRYFLRAACQPEVPFIPRARIGKVLLDRLFLHQPNRAREHAVHLITRLDQATASRAGSSAIAIGTLDAHIDIAHVKLQGQLPPDETVLKGGASLDMVMLFKDIPDVQLATTFCTHWIYRGECQYIDRCKFLHVMPDRRTLSRMGHRSVPRWWTSLTMRRADEQHGNSVAVASQVLEITAVQPCDHIDVAGKIVSTEQDRPSIPASKRSSHDMKKPVSKMAVHQKPKLDTGKRATVKNNVHAKGSPTALIPVLPQQRRANPRKATNIKSRGSTLSQDPLIELDQMPEHHASTLPVANDHVHASQYVAQVDLLCMELTAYDTEVEGPGLSHDALSAYACLLPERR